MFLFYYKICSGTKEWIVMNHVNNFILNGACRNYFRNLHWSLKKENKTKYHAKIDIFLIDSEQIKYLEHFKIKIIHCGNRNEFCIHCVSGRHFFLFLNIKNVHKISTKGKIFNFFILIGACRNFYGNQHWSLKKENKTKYHAKIDIFLIESGQKKYLE